MAWIRTGSCGSATCSRAWPRRAGRCSCRPHLMSEMSLTAEHLIVIGKGRLIADLPIAEMIGAASRASVLVRSPEAARLRDLLAGPDVSTTSQEVGELVVVGVSAPQIGDIA